MQKQIDAFTSLTGWSGSVAGVSADSLNQIPEFIAGLHDASVVFVFGAGAVGRYVQKTVSVDITNHNEITFHIWSRNKKGTGVEYKKASDFAYSIDFGTGVTYYIPAHNTFTDVTIDVSGMTTVSRIRITALTADADYIIISNMVAVRDEIPVDIFRGVQAQLQNDLLAYYGNIPQDSGVVNKGILIASLSGLVLGDTSILLTTPKYVEKYSVIMITDGTNTEYHQIDKNDEHEYFFTSRYDGKSLKYAFATASVYLVIPVEYGLAENDIFLPGISVWGMSPEEVFRSSKLDEASDTLNGSENTKNRLTQTSFMYTILIDCEARHNSLIAHMSKVVRDFIAREYVWCNGKKLNVKANGAGQYVDATEGYNEIPKIQYSCDIEIREEVYPRQTLVKSTADDINITVQRGTL